MSKVTRWLKTTHEGLREQVDTTVAYLSDSEVKTRAGFTPAEQYGKWLVEVFMTTAASYIAAYNAWKNPATCTTGITEAFKAAEGEMINVFETLHNILVASPFITNVDLVNMEMPARREGPKNDSPVETHEPGIEVDTSRIRTVRFKFHDIATGRRGKPPGQQGAEARYLVVDAYREVEIEELVHSAFSTRSPLTLEFLESQLGKILIFVLRWENKRGEKGPFSAIAWVMIP